MKQTLETKIDRFITERTQIKDASIHFFICSEVEFSISIRDKNTIKYIPKTDEDRDVMLANPSIIFEHVVNTYGGCWHQDESDPFIVMREQ